MPGPQLANDASGTIVSVAVLTEAPEDDPPLPTAPMLFCARLRAALLVVLAAWAPPEVTVPLGALLVWVPVAVPPEVLIRTRSSESGLWVHFGSTSMITWYWLTAW